MAIPQGSIKQGDTRPLLYGTLTAGGVPIDLTTASTVKFTMTNAAGSVVISLAACVIVSAAAGIVSYAWQSADTATAGEFQGEFKITWADSSIQRVPNRTNFQVIITPNLA